MPGRLPARPTLSQGCASIVFAGGQLMGLPATVGRLAAVPSLGSPVADTAAHKLVAWGPVAAVLDSPAAAAPIPDRMAPAGEIVASCQDRMVFVGKMALEVCLPGRRLVGPVVLPAEQAAGLLVASPGEEGI